MIGKSDLHAVDEAGGHQRRFSDRLPCERNRTSDSSLSRATTSTAARSGRWRAAGLCLVALFVLLLPANVYEQPAPDLARSPTSPRSRLHPLRQPGAASPRPLARKAAHAHGRLASNSGTVSMTAPGSPTAASSARRRTVVCGNASSCAQLRPVAQSGHDGLWRGIGGRIGGRLASCDLRPRSAPKGPRSRTSSSGLPGC